MIVDYNLILQKAREYKPEISRFLRDMLAIPSESGQEERVILRIKEEMEKVGFHTITIDEMGNIYGSIGHGKHVIAMDAHIDTVGVGRLENWDYDPYQGYEDEEIIIGRGSSDQTGGMASMVYAGKIIKDLKLEDDYTLVMTGTVQEEDCDGLCWMYILDHEKIKPEFVVSTESTACRIYRGHRGRMEIKVSTQGISCHGSAPERGENAIFKMAPILLELEQLNHKLKHDEFLGKGTLTVSEIFYSSPSRCAVADGCSISIDRRLTQGETPDSALQEIRDLPAVKTADAAVEIYGYDKPSYTGFVYPTEAFFPTWQIAEDHIVTQTLVESYQGLFKKEPRIDKWTFSTNGVAIMGRHGVPCIGFGPGHEEEGHAPNEKTWKNELVEAAAMYAVIPLKYLEKIKAAG
ncbi:MAG: YgeY family selenium metabolism-linked hydrolase [Candidatus Neomarinimicrobiota bacterium]